VSDTDLRALAEAASPGPWQWLDSGGEPDGDELQDGNGEMVATGFRDDLLPDVTDGRFCAAARNALPALLDRITALEEVAAAARFMSDLVDEVYGTDNDPSEMPEEAEFRRHRAVIAKLDAAPVSIQAVDWGRPEGDWTVKSDAP